MRVPTIARGVLPVRRLLVATIALFAVASCSAQEHGHVSLIELLRPQPGETYSYSVNGSTDDGFRVLGLELSKNGGVMVQAEFITPKEPPAQIDKYELLAKGDSLVRVSSAGTETTLLRMPTGKENPRWTGQIEHGPGSGPSGPMSLPSNCSVTKQFTEVIGGRTRSAVEATCEAKLDDGARYVSQTTFVSSIGVYRQIQSIIGNDGGAEGKLIVELVLPTGTEGSKRP